MKITFVIMSAYGMGGTIRTVITLANRLAEDGHQVEIISILRRRPKPFFPIDERVTVRTVLDHRRRRRGRGWRGALMRWTCRRRSLLMHSGDNAYPALSLWTDIKLLAMILRLRSDVLVTTRPLLNIFSARFAPRRLIRVGQEHVSVGARSPALQRAMGRQYPRLDAVVTLTPAHHDDMERLVAGRPLVRRIIPNSIDIIGRPASSQQNPLVVVAGRLAPIKQYHHLIRAFAKVVALHPEWKLRIYGNGKTKPRLQALINALGLYNHVLLMGRSATVDREYAKASLTAMTSSFEGLPMTLIEAMSAGVPAVSYDCPHGPRAVITDGRDGLLVPLNNIGALADGLLKLIEDEELRMRMAAAAKDSAMRFDSHTVAKEWIELFAELVERRGRTHRGWSFHTIGGRPARAILNTVRHRRARRSP